MKAAAEKCMTLFLLYIFFLFFSFLSLYLLDKELESVLSSIDSLYRGCVELDNTVSALDAYTKTLETKLKHFDAILSSKD